MLFLKTMVAKDKQNRADYPFAVVYLHTDVRDRGPGRRASPSSPRLRTPCAQSRPRRPTCLCRQRGDLVCVPRVRTYLNDVFVFHPGRKREALAQDLKQHRPERVVVVSPHLPHTLDAVLPEQLLASLWAQKQGLRFPRKPVGTDAGAAVSSQTCGHRRGGCGFLLPGQDSGVRVRAFSARCYSHTPCTTATKAVTH